LPAASGLVWPAGVEPALLELRPRDGRGWNRTSGLLCVRQALSPAELLARGGQGWSRTSGLFRIREALSTELPAQMVPGQGFEPRSRRSERRVLPVRRSRTECNSNDTFGVSQTMFSKPLAYPSALDRRVRRPTWRGFGARVSNACGKRACQSTCGISCAIYSAQSAERSFSLRRGLDSF
jgi:hypothetical protein